MILRQGIQVDIAIGVLRDWNDGRTIKRSIGSTGDIDYEDLQCRIFKNGDVFTVALSESNIVLGNDGVAVLTLSASDTDTSGPLLVVIDSAWDGDTATSSEAILPVSAQFHVGGIEALIDLSNIPSKPSRVSLEA